MAFGAGRQGRASLNNQFDILSDLAPLQRHRRDAVKPYVTGHPKIPLLSNVTTNPFGGTTGKFSKKGSAPIAKGSSGFYNLATMTNVSKQQQLQQQQQARTRPSSARLCQRTTRMHSDTVENNNNDNDDEYENNDERSRGKPTVEVTVRTHSRSRTERQQQYQKGTQQQKQNNMTEDVNPAESNLNTSAAWSKLLRGSSSGIQHKSKTAFGHFDPLRTLHFLGRELQSKLKNEQTGDPTVQEILTEMQDALNRVPSDISLIPEATQSRQVPAEPPELEKNLEQQTLPPQRIKPLSQHQQQVPQKRPPTRQDLSEAAPHQKLLNDRIEEDNDDEYMPEIRILRMESVTGLPESSGKFRRHLESTAAKLEENCRHLEKQMIQMKKENDQLTELLKTERDMVCFLKKELDDLRNEKIDDDNLVCHRLLKEKDAMQIQIRKLEEEMAETKNAKNHELKNMLDELQTERNSIKQENIELRHKVTILDLEKEKFAAILNVRDRQINEIRLEMSQLQEAVNDQLTELQKSPFLSSSASTITDSNSAEQEPIQNLQKCADTCDDHQHLMNNKQAVVVSNPQELFLQSKDSVSVADATDPANYVAVRKRCSSQHDLLLPASCSKTRIENVVPCIGRTKKKRSSHKKSSRGQQLLHKVNLDAVMVAAADSGEKMSYSEKVNVSLALPKPCHDPASSR